MFDWAEAEVGHAQLGDQRLNRRLVRIVSGLAARPTASVPHAFQDWSAVKATYRFWDSERVRPDAILAAHGSSTQERVQGHQRVLALQDTTSLDFTTHPKTNGLGPLEHPAHSGLHVHSVLLSTLEGVPLGLLDHQVWARDGERAGQRHQRRTRPTAEKESQRWLTALTATIAQIPAPVQVTTVADREADIYDLMAAPRREGADLLIRITHNRRVTHEARTLWEAIQQEPVQDHWPVHLKRKDNQQARTAMLSIRFCALDVLPPQHRAKREGLQPVSVWVVLAEETAAPAGVPPVRWLLLTTCPVTTVDEAVQCVQWYSRRWLIERYHYVLKSGCQIEELQLQEARRLLMALTTYAVVAWLLLWLTYQARQGPDESCASVLAAHEWRSLYCFTHKTPVPPKEPPTLREAVRWIAKLGGFLGRKHDGEPGVKVLWRGWTRLQDISATWQFLQN
ncbi:MAG: IS4 family transposase [Dehalococcoidia bacterium]